MRLHISSKSLFAVLCAFLLLIGAVIGSNVAVSQGQAVSGCVNKKSGILRISDECSKSEKKIHGTFMESKVKRESRGKLESEVHREGQDRLC